MQPAQATCRSW